MKYCPRIDGLSWLGRKVALHNSCIVCPGPNMVTSYDPERRNDEGRLLPENLVVCCQDPIELKPDERIIDQRTSQENGGQLHVIVKTGSLGEEQLRVTHWLDNFDPIPLGTVVLDALGQQVLGTSQQE